MSYNFFMGTCLVYLIFVVAAVSSCQSHNIVKRSGRCVLPPYPEDGFYVVAGDPYAQPGEDPEYAHLNFSCKQGYGVTGNNVMLCVQGEWSTTVIPQCHPICELRKHASVVYSCNRPGSKDFVACDEFEPIGTKVKATCRPGYYHLGPMPKMMCVLGMWTYTVLCTPECGRVADSELLPWHAWIQNYLIISCAGSIISKTIVLSAAHCVWKETGLSPSGYRVIVGKKNNFSQVNKDIQYEVKDIKVPERYQGALANYQDDIALLILASEIQFSRAIQPVCLDFDESFKTSQLQPGNLGTLNVVNGSSLLVKKIPYVPIEECIKKVPVLFREFITSDKFCAGQENGTTICRGNSGAGLSFPDDVNDVQRHFIRGLVSTAPINESRHDCNPVFVAFTEINKHEHFIRKYFV